MEVQPAVCGKCGARKDGRCKPCNSEYWRKWYAANKQTHKARTKAYREANLTQRKAYERAYRETKKDVIKERGKMYRACNAKKLDEYQRAYRAANALRLSTKNEAFRAANLPQIREQQRKHSARERAELADTYILQLIQRSTHIQRSRIPPQLVAAVRINVQIKRLLKEIT